MIKHFNLNITEKETNKINKETYLDLKYKDRSESFIEEQRRRIEYNYDLNMKYFESLDFDKFNKYIEKFVKKNKFVEIKDLTQYKQKVGVYIMVLDDYKQAYIGMSEKDIVQRIKQHWKATMRSDRLIYGRAYDSILSIDSFGALDTTRVFFKEDNNPLDAEYQYEQRFDNKYLLNRTCGGIGSSYRYTDNSVSAKLAVMANRHSRDFSKFIDKNELYQKCNSYDIVMYEDKKIRVFTQ